MNWSRPAHEAGVIPEISLPNHWPRNAILERDVLQSGLPYQYHVHPYPFACLSMSFDRPAICDSSKTQWEVINCKPFDGIRKCFGQLVFTTETNVLTNELSNQTCLQVCSLDGALTQDFDTSTSSRFSTTWITVLQTASVIDCPEMEVYVEEGPPHLEEVPWELLMI